MRDIIEIVRLRISRPLSIVFAVALAGCVPHATELEQPQDTLQAAQPTRSETPACRPAAALLMPQSAPDCAFKASHLKTIDPGQWTQLKVAYELKCYQNAEKQVRERLRRLQAANRCEIQSARR
jgi:hypothetical protein